jgi:hypothetical protein
MKMFEILCFVFITSTLLYSCASQSPLGGGLKDETPPKLVKAIPDENSKNVRPKEIEFVFDEFIQLKSLQQKILISPPFNHPPDVKLKSKSFTLIFNDTLLPNTTYSLYFGDAIVDLNENNPLKDYTYVFSTGNVIDSLCVNGYVFDALTQKADMSMLVSLYSDTTDSVPFLKNPTYVTRTSTDGKFSFKHVKQGNYKMVAILDKNNNYRFDAGTEKVAFKEKILTVESNKDSLILYSFLEHRNPQYVKKINRPLPYKAEIIFNSEFDTKKPTLISSNAKVLQTLYSLNSDTITLFFADSTTYLNDTIMATLTYPKQDSLLNTYSINKEIKLVYTPPLKKAEPVSKISFTTAIKKETAFDKVHPLWLKFSEPVLLSDSSFRLFQMQKDSSYAPVLSSVQNDSVDAQKYYLNANIQDGNKYRLILNANHIKSYYAHTIKGDTLSFGTLQTEDYAALLLKLNLPDSNQTYIFELMNEKGDAVIRRWIQHQSGALKLERILPGKYSLRCFNDKNNNSIWDTGFYILKMQPEKIYIYPQIIQLRANWDLEVNWNVKSISN